MALQGRTYVISDLHLGGAYGNPDDPDDRGFRLCTQVDRLTAFVNRLSEYEPARARTELVINGDFVDFLTEDTGTPGAWTPFVTDGRLAAEMLERIISRDRPFFDALAHFLGRGHRLVLLLGNHDVELALPAVRRALREALGATDRHDFHFIDAAEAYVGGDALIEHGNRYDEWNVVDHEGLVRVRAFQSRNQELPEERKLQPSAGALMVSSIMNAVKQRYRFVDLLKPENDGVIPLLLAIEPGYKRLLGPILELWDKAAEHRLAAPALPASGDIASHGGSSVRRGGDLAWRRPVSPDIVDPLRRSLERTLGADADRFLTEIEEPGLDQPKGDFEAEGDTASFMDRMQRRIGVARLLMARHDPARIEKRLPALQMAFRALRDDKTFSRETETMPEYIEASRQLAKGGFRWVVFGHTHLARNVDLGGGARYLNSGTWADLLSVPGDITSGSDSAMNMLRDFVADLRKNRLTDWGTFSPTYVRLDIGEGGRVVDASLHDHSPTGEPSTNVACLRSSLSPPKMGNPWTTPGRLPRPRGGMDRRPNATNLGDGTQGFLAGTRRN